MNLRGLNVKIAKDVSAVYDEIVWFAHIFLSKAVSSSLYLLVIFPAWDPDEVLRDKNILIREWNGKALAYLFDEFDNEKLSF